MKRMSKGQTRMGSAARRQLEWQVIVHQVKHRKEAFARRLTKNISRRGVGPLGCLRYLGTLDRNGYPRMNFRDPEHGHVTILANRVFCILKEARPMQAGHDAAHTDGCRDRRCIRHVEQQPFQVNARTNGPHAGIPF